MSAQMLSALPLGPMYRVALALCAHLLGGHTVRPDSAIKVRREVRGEFKSA